MTRPTTRLRQLIESPKLLVMPGAFDPISAKLIERAGFEAIQCTGAGIAAAHLGLPDYSTLGMTDMVDRTRRIVEAVSLPVMADGDTGFGNAVNVYYAVRAFERAGAAGVNLEDQVMPKRCGHLEGKQVVPLDEAVAKISAAADAREDKDFVINARTDTLATHGIGEVVRRGNAYLRAGATMVFIDGITSEEEIAAAVAGIDGPVAINLVEGGKSPRHLSFSQLERLGVARVSLPASAFLAAIQGMQVVLASIRENGGVTGYDDHIADFRVAMHDLFGMGFVNELESRYVGHPVTSAAE